VAVSGVSPLLDAGRFPGILFQPSRGPISFFGIGDANTSSIESDRIDGATGFDEEINRFRISNPPFRRVG
jgi:hypothetical protein